MQNSDKPIAPAFAFLHGNTSDDILAGDLLPFRRGWKRTGRTRRCGFELAGADIAGCGSFVADQLLTYLNLHTLCLLCSPVPIQPEMLVVHKQRRTAMKISGELALYTGWDMRLWDLMLPQNFSILNYLALHSSPPHGYSATR
jgi:hypothetical protein